MAATTMLNGSKNLKLRRHTTAAANPQDLDDVECGKQKINDQSTSSSNDSSDQHADNDSDKKDDDYVLSRRSAEFLSDLSPFSRRVVRFVTPSHPSLPDRCTSECLTVAAVRIIPSMAVLLALPLVMWDGLPDEWGMFNLYPFFRHVEIVWASLLHTSAWPIAVGTFLVAAFMPRGGVGSSKYLPVKRAGARDKLSAAVSVVTANVTQSGWKTCVALSMLFCATVVINMTLQTCYPRMLWNPFMWGSYHVYLPSSISNSLKGACLDFEQHSASRQPLCLSETQWNELSSGQLSSHNPDDVLTVQKGLDYLQNQSGGLIINAIARNVADSIPALQQNIEGLAPFFKDSHNKLSLVIFENDSDDGTRNAFQTWADQDSLSYTVDLMGCGPKNPNCDLGIMDRYDNMNLFTNPTASGVGKLGEFRQILLEYILGKEEYKDHSHMVILDADLGTSLSPLGLLHTLGLENGIAQEHGVASSSSQVWPGSMGTIIPPYDLSAFRPKETESNKKVRGMHTSFCHLLPAGDRWRNMCEAASPMQLFMIQSAADTSNHHEQPYEVVSAFNGLTMYPMGLIRDSGSQAQYNAGDDGQQCEHVGFHLSLQKPMYVNPKWSMNLKPNKPGGPVGWRAMKTIMYAVLGRPNVMILIVTGNFVFFFALVSSCWMIATSIKSLVVLWLCWNEKRNTDRDKRECFDVSGN